MAKNQVQFLFLCGGDGKDKTCPHFKPWQRCPSICNSHRLAAGSHQNICVCDAAVIAQMRAFLDKHAPDTRKNEITPTSATVGLINPRSGAVAPEHNWTWAQVRTWARENVHESNRKEWLRHAREAFRYQDGAELGRIIIGS